MSAPLARRVDMLSGDVAPTRYFQALSEADNLCREVDGLRELQTRVQELEAERDQLARDLTDALVRLGFARGERDTARAERDTARLVVAK